LGRVNSRTGEAKDKLNILESWESSEIEILQEFCAIFNPDEKWKFIPIGCNLSFDFTSLICRWRKIDIKVNAKNLFAEHLYIDIQPILIMFNKGSFSRAALEKQRRGAEAVMKLDWERKKVLGLRDEFY